MKTKRLGNSDLFITQIGFGAWVIGGSAWEFGWGEQDDKQLLAATTVGDSRMRKQII
jgi:aryl-alcohol dehydrogenase-like predicted oxidoreductase